MNEGKVTIERRGHVLLIGLDRVPKRNAFDVAMYRPGATGRPGDPRFRTPDSRPRRSSGLRAASS